MSTTIDPVVAAPAAPAADAAPAAPAAPVAPAAPRTAVADYCLTLLNQLGLEQNEPDGLMRAVGVTGCTRGEGASTVAANLAVTAATLLNQRVTLIDCNLSRPAVHRLFGVKLSPGLVHALREPSRIAEFLQPSRIENLTLLTAGEVGDGSICASPNLTALLDAMNAQCDLTIVDLPCVSRSDCVGVGKCLDGVLLVVEAEKVRWEVAQRTSASLSGAGVNLVGAVMNKRRQHVPRWLYKTL